MEQFSHLRFIQTLTGKAKFSGGGGSNPTTVKNKANRHSHSSILRASTSKIQSDWLNDFSKRKELDLAPLDKNIVPLYIQINPELLNI